MRKGCIVHHHTVMIIERCRGKCLRLNTHANHHHHHIGWIQILVRPLKPQQIADFPICSGDCCLSFTLPVHTLQFSAPITHCISPTHTLSDINCQPVTPPCYYQSSVFRLNPAAFSVLGWDAWVGGAVLSNTSAMTLWHLARQTSAALEGFLQWAWAGCSPSHKENRSHIWLVIKTLNRGNRM